MGGRGGAGRISRKRIIAELKTAGTWEVVRTQVGVQWADFHVGWSLGRSAAVTEGLERDHHMSVP